MAGKQSSTLVQGGAARSHEQILVLFVISGEGRGRVINCTWKKNKALSQDIIQDNDLTVAVAIGISFQDKHHRYQYIPKSQFRFFVLFYFDLKLRARL